jgi:hypothetical protein
MNQCNQILGLQELPPSPLLRKIECLVDGRPVLQCLRQLAVERGCRHYENAFEAPDSLPQALRTLTSEEVIVALCLAHFGRQPLDIRIAGELLSAEGVDVSRIAILAAQESCADVVAYIAKVGQKVEPAYPLWQALLKALPQDRTGFHMQLPHWSRFVSMTGISRNGGKHIEWLRPCALP